MPFVCLGAVVLFLLFFAASLQIGEDVRKQCDVARQIYGGDCVEGLIETLHDETQSFKTRNSAVWALGQMGDSRALPELQKYYTGNIPSKESLDRGFSQYELKKAIHLTSGGLNITAFVWRDGL